MNAIPLLASRPRRVGYRQGARLPVGLKPLGHDLSVGGQTRPMKLSMGLAILASLGTAPAYAAPTLTTIATFTATNGSAPLAGVIADASGNLYGTTAHGGGGSSAGTVFEIPNTGGGFGALTTLATFTPTNGIYQGGANPEAPLFQDASGNLFGTTLSGGTYGGHARGTVFEIPNAGGGTYGSLATIWNITGTTGFQPTGGLTADASGNLFGTSSTGQVFEIPKTGTGYGTLSVVAQTAGAYGGVTMDASGDLFGTGPNGTYNQGVVWEIPKTGGTYGTETILANFNVADGANPVSGVIIDAAGNLFGTDQGNSGAASAGGTVFEIPNTGGGTYGSLITLAHLDGGGNSGLIEDALGNLFGTASTGGTYGQGAVFEIPNTGGHYGAEIDLVSFDATNGGAYDPLAGLFADPSGNLFGTTGAGGGSVNCTNGCGTVFELTGSGFQTATNSPEQVPEPASILAFGAGTAALAIVRRRRRQISCAGDVQA